ncbi:MAG: 23S rRNA (uracil(1939)-C(5))-methyltransferase RlmD [Myxococcales bacterium]|nr:23S rRNA (uracil(1939)-C(5))-methyltransferase RlmD [Myxococcales bacterium]
MKPTKQKVPREVLIERFDARGGGAGVDSFGRTWSVRGAPVGATIAAGGRAHDGTRLGTISASADSVAPRCGVFGVCGGCQWQEMPAERQREEKGRMLGRLLADLRGPPGEGSRDGVPVDHGVIGSGPEYGYRNKIELTFGTGRYLLSHELNTEISRMGRWLGFHAPGRYDRIVDTPDCAIASPAINAVYARIRLDILASDLPAWDADAHTGFFRNLVLREGRGAAVLVAVYTAPATDEQTRWMRAHAPGWGAACVGWFENATVADAVGGQLREVLVDSGDGLAVSATLAGLKFWLSPTAFFQVNVPAAEEMIKVVRRFLSAPRPAPASGPTTLWDLYCGAGLFGLACAGDFDEVVGIEAVEVAVRDATRNAAANGITNARFVAGTVEQLVGGLTAGPGASSAPTAIIVDPPRNGLHPEVLKVLASLASRPLVLVYVSCKPTSLLRDSKVLMDAGWRCTDRVAIDLFPQTAHIEVVTRWVSSPSG